ncbi:MAG: hypothetical protein K8F56_02440 [Rhodocyclaceae bacterium]|nr:hypothetical protein [Rhodocyclaceae bacterium]
MKNLDWRARLRRIAYRVSPAATTTLLSMRSRRLSHRLVRRWGLPRLTDLLVQRDGLVVSGGPFRGLRLPAGARREHLAPFLLGTYESELHPWLEEVRRKDFRQIIDIGAKFGYYALGLARWFPDAESLAFDTDPWARRLIRVAARENGLASVRACGYLTPSTLRARLRPPAFIFSDCEGFEAQLFPAIDPGELATSWLLIELHETAAPGVERMLIAHFAPTHEVEVVDRAERVPEERLVERLGAADAELAVKEFRGDQRWLLARPRIAVSSIESRG